MASAALLPMPVMAASPKRIIDAELMPALVDIRSEGLDAHRLALVHEFGDFSDVVEVAAHHGGHILRGVVGLEVGRLVCHP